MHFTNMNELTKKNSNGSGISSGTDHFSTNSQKHLESINGHT